MMWYLKKHMFCRNKTFLTDASFLNGLTVIHFWSVCLLSFGLAIIHHPLNMFHVECVRAYHVCFRMHAYFHYPMRDCIGNCVHDHMSNCLYDHMHDLYGRSSVQTADLAAGSFCGSQVKFLGTTTCFWPVIFLAY